MAYRWMWEVHGHAAMGVTHMIYFTYDWEQLTVRGCAAVGGGVKRSTYGIEFLVALIEGIKDRWDGLRFEAAKHAAAHARKNFEKVDCGQ